LKGKELNILYVDDEVNNLVAFKANFRKDYKVFTAESAAEGFEILRKNNIQVIITDQKMPNMTGVEFLASLIKEFPDPFRIILTGFADIKTIIDAINMGKVDRYFLKPFNKDELKKTLDDAFEIYYLREEKKKLVEKLMEVNDQLEFILRQKLLS
jgi:response regulator RpfG family c-di-GMP phosphodiesterase